jgi:zinc transport system substrate-binding protein
VVTSLYPLQFVAEQIGGPYVDVQDLTHPGQEPHDLELTVRQTAEVADADLVVYAKGLQPAVDDTVAADGPSRTVDASAAAGLRDGDPHFWLDPERLARVAEAVTAQLSKVDPDHAAAYDRRLADLRDRLEALDRDFRAGLARCRTTTVVVSHDAFGYLEKYGLTFAPIVGLSPEAEPSPAHLAALERLAREKGVTTVFSETLTSAATAHTLATELGLRTAVLDPVEGLTDATSGEDYLTLMRADLAALREAGNCA